MDSFEIGDRAVGPGEPTFVIAEAGSNHNGDLDLAKKLIDAAADAGADAVKFQVFRAEKLYVDDTGEHDSAYETVAEYELPYEWLPELRDRCHARDVQFMATPFDEASASELADYVPAFKIASFSLTHYPLLEAVAEHDRPMLVSTGAHGREEIERSVALLFDAGVDDLALLHCISSYPTPLEEANVRAVRTLRSEFDVVGGISDHTLDPEIAPAAATTLGGSVVEKHFTLDSTMEGPDHEFALEPPEFERMVAAIRNTERALGDGTLSPRDVEGGTQSRARRRIYAARRIDAGDVVEADAVQLLRSGYTDDKGLHPKHLETIVGTELREAVEAGAPITRTHVDLK